MVIILVEKDIKCESAGVQKKFPVSSHLRTGGGGEDRGACIIKPFTPKIYSTSSTVCHFHPNVVFAGKAGSYLSEDSNGTPL